MKISNTREVRSVFAFVAANSEKIHRLINELPQDYACLWCSEHKRNSVHGKSPPYSTHPKAR